MSRVADLLGAYLRRRHPAVRAVQGLFLASGVAMAAAAGTSGSDHHLKADGTKGRADDVQGDPGGKPTDDVGQAGGQQKKKDAGEKTDPDSDTNELDGSGAASR